MGYYQGDFYAGARGDPGFFSFLGKAAGAAVGMIPGVGGIASKALGALSKVRGTKAAMTITAHPVISAAAAAGTIGAGTALMRTGGARPMGMGMRGYHIEKKGKHAGQLIKNRRMRVTNVRALRRAIRRCTGFSHLAKRVLRFTSPRPPRGRAVFKHIRRKRKV
jgi:hypothetical protein